MYKKLYIFSLIFFFFFLIIGCDNYSLHDQFYNDDDEEYEITLVPQKTSLQQGELIDLYPSGGIEPYSFNIVEGSLYYSGTLGSIADERYTAGTSIGTIQIQVTDINNYSAETELTIIPPTPSGFIVGSVGTNRIDLSWSYSDTSIISGFRIMRKRADEEAFEHVTDSSNSATSFSDSPLNPTFLYSYYIYAVSGEYISLPTATESDQPNS